MARFDCPSSFLQLRMPVTVAPRALWTGLAVAMALHLGLTLVTRPAQAHKPLKPLTTRFVKRLPRLTKPLELKKRPRPKRRQVQRRMISVQARAALTQATTRFQPREAIGGLTRPQTVVGRAIPHHQMQAEPAAFAQTVHGTRESGRAVDLSLEMVGIDALDTGRYQAMVIQDPTDKRGIRGYLHLVLVHVLPLNRMTVTNALHTDLGIKRLMHSLNEWTDIEANIVGRGDFTSPQTLQTPWIYSLVYRAFELTQAETEAVGEYTTSGGFLFCDEGIRVRSATYISVPRAFRQMFASGFETQGLSEGRDWYTGEVPPGHPIFGCYFDLQGPPIGYWWPTMANYPIYQDEPMIGVFLRDTLVGIITRRGYVATWYGKGWVLGSPNDMSQVPQRQRALQFGINTIIYALTREGSITSRVMDLIQ